MNRRRAEFGMEIQVQREAQATAHGAEQSYSTAPPRPRPHREAEWSESALRVLQERYLMKRNGVVVETPDEMCWRVATSVAAAESNWVSAETVAECEVA